MTRLEGLEDAARLIGEWGRQGRDARAESATPVTDPAPAARRSDLLR